MGKSASNQKLDVVMSAFSERYGTACDNAPPLPPAPPSFVFISADALRKEAFETAPLNTLSVSAQGFLLQGRLTRLQVMLRKSVEFRIFHMQQYEVFTRRLRIFYYLMTLVSTSVSVILLVFVDHQWSTIAASAASILVGILASYTRFVKYEGTAEGHLNASKTFEDVARDINTFFASVTPDQLDKVNIQELVQDMENDSAEERSTYSTTAASSAKGPMDRRSPGPVAEGQEQSPLLEMSSSSHDSMELPPSSPIERDDSPGLFPGNRSLTKQLLPPMSHQSNLGRGVPERASQGASQGLEDVQRPMSDDPAQHRVSFSSHLPSPAASGVGNAKGIPGETSKGPILRQPSKKVLKSSIIVEQSAAKISTRLDVTARLPSNKNNKLQMWYHESCEYKRAHGLAEKEYEAVSQRVGFSVLILSGLIQLVLLLDPNDESGNSEKYKTTGAVISAIITALNGVAGYHNFDGKSQAHGEFSREFHRLQRELANLLMCYSLEHQEMEFNTISTSFGNAMTSMPPLNMGWFERHPGFEFINQEALIQETAMDPSQAALTNLKSAVTTIEDMATKKKRKKRTATVTPKAPETAAAEA